MTDAKVFISYKNYSLSRMMGRELERRLLDSGFDDDNIFFDQSDLKEDGGALWDDTLRINVSQCEIVLVLIQKETSESEWVKKEIDIARDKLAEVIPIIVDHDNDIHPTLDAMEISQLQYLPFDGRDHEFEIIRKAIIERAASVREKRKFEKDVKESQDLAFYLRGSVDRVRVEILTGDATKKDGYDVLVNSENDYLQMARFFESNTLSGTIRWKGARHLPSGYVEEDTVQQQLYRQVDFSPHYPAIPVNRHQIVVTEAGHPQSALGKSDYRFIFHAVTVTMDRFSRNITPSALPAISFIAQQCLVRLQSINEAGGAVLYTAENSLEDPRPDFQPLASILIPLFGAGSGGHKEIDSARAIIEGIKTYLTDHRDVDLRLAKIGVCIYRPDEETKLQVFDYFEQNGFVRE